MSPRTVRSYTHKVSLPKHEKKKDYNNRNANIVERKFTRLQPCMKNYK